MGISFTPELIRLFLESGCSFERHGKGNHDILMLLLDSRNIPSKWYR